MAGEHAQEDMGAHATTANAAEGALDAGPLAGKRGGGDLGEVALTGPRGSPAPQSTADASG